MDMQGEERGTEDGDGVLLTAEGRQSSGDTPQLPRSVPRAEGL